MSRKEKKAREQKHSTRQLINTKAVSDYSLKTYDGDELVYFMIQGTEVFSYLDRIEKSLKEQRLSASRAGSEDIKRIMAVYYEQNVTSEKFEDFEGERWIIPDD